MDAAVAADLTNGQVRRELVCLDSRRPSPVSMLLTQDRLELTRKNAAGEAERLEAQYRSDGKVLYIENARLVNVSTGQGRNIPGEQRVGSVANEGVYLILAEPLVPRGYGAEELERRLREGDLGLLVGLRWLMVCHDGR